MIASSFIFLTVIRLAIYWVNSSVSFKKNSSNVQKYQSIETHVTDWAPAIKKRMSIFAEFSLWYNLVTSKSYSVAVLTKTIWRRYLSFKGLFTNGASPYIMTDHFGVFSIRILPGSPAGNVPKLGEQCKVRRKYKSIVLRYFCVPEDGTTGFAGNEHINTPNIYLSCRATFAPCITGHSSVI